MNFDYEEEISKLEKDHNTDTTIKTITKQFRLEFG